MCWAIPKSPMPLPWRAKTGENGSITNCLRRCLSASANYKNLFNSSTSLNTVVEDTACDGGVLPNSANIFLALDMASG